MGRTRRYRSRLKPDGSGTIFADVAVPEGQRKTLGGIEFPTEEIGKIHFNADGHIGWIGVQPEWQRQGLATELSRQAKAHNPRLKHGTGDFGRGGDLTPDGRKFAESVDFDRLSGPTPAEPEPDLGMDEPPGRLDRVRLENGDIGTVAAVEGSVLVVKTDKGAIRKIHQSRVTKLAPPGGPDAPAPLSSPVWQRPNTDLTEQDKSDMYDYAWDFHSYSSINDSLRNDHPLGRYAPLAYRLEKLIDRSSLPARARLYRNTADVPELAQQIKDAHRSGTPWTEKGFMSTSLDPNIPVGFDIGDAEGAIDFNISIDAPKGAKALVFDGAISDMPGASEQYEVLLQRGSRFRIDNVTTDEDGRTKVDMTLLGADVTPDRVLTLSSM